MVAPCVTPFRKVIRSESPSGVFNLREIIMSSLRGRATGLPVIHDRAADIDVGSRFHVVAVGSDLCDEAVPTFAAFTGDLERMAEWLVSLGTRTVAREFTGGVLGSGIRGHRESR